MAIKYTFFPDSQHLFAWPALDSFLQLVFGKMDFKVFVIYFDIGHRILLIKPRIIEIIGFLQR